MYQKLAGRFPSVLFPGLPRKPLIVSTSAVHERRKVMDEVMHLVARTQKLCCSPMVLEFLGVRKPQRVSNQAIVVNDDIFEERKVEQVRIGSYVKLLVRRVLSDRYRIRQEKFQYHRVVSKSLQTLAPL